MVIYTGAGIVLGWPFDYLAELKERQAGSAEDGSKDVPQDGPETASEEQAGAGAAEPAQEST